MKKKTLYGLILISVFAFSFISFQIPVALALFDFWGYGWETWQTSPFDGTVGDASADDSNPHSGTYHGRADPTEGAGVGYYYEDIDETYVDVTWYYSLPASFVSSSAKECHMVRIYGSGNDRIYVYYFANGASSQLGIGLYGTSSNQTTQSLDTNYHKYRLISNITSPGNHAMMLYMDDVLKLTYSGYNGGFDSYTEFRIGIHGSTTIFGEYCFDDVFWGIPTLISADLEPDNTGADWVFTEWRYYTFTATIPSTLYSENLDYVFIGFTELIYSNGTFGFSAWSNGTGWDCASNIAVESRDLEPVRVKEGSWSNDSDETIVTFPLWFTKRCLDIWLDNDAVDVLLWFNDTTGSDSGWFTAKPGYFRVYTDGGFSRVYDGYGDSGVLPGGRDFNMYAFNDSYVFKDMYWRNLQHIKMVPEIQFRAGYQYFQFNWGCDYVLQDGTYQPGLHLQIEPGAVSYTGVFASNVWINYTASWYSNNTLIKQEDLYAFYHGEVYTAGDYGRVKFFIDFWFDSGNASSLQGGRINAYEFPMKDSSGAWFRWLSSSWGIMDEVQKQSECIVPLIKYGAGDGEEGINSERIEFVRVWSSLSVPAGAYDQYVAAINYDTFDTTLGENPLKGIQTPPWDETQMPAVRNTGALGAIWSMFSGIGAWLGENILWGGLNLWGTFVNFLDTIAGWLGAPGFFTNLFSWIGEGFSYLGTSAGYAWDVLANIFLLIGSLIGAFVVTVGELIGSFVNTLSGFVDFMGGGVGAAGNLWEQLGIMTWVTVFIVFYPLYLVILWDQKGMDAVIQQLTWIFGMLVWLYHFFEGVVMGVISLITSLVESIPVAE